ncbi:MAG TPA: type IV pilus assembly protein PilM, partial [Lentisphaeria bacterium]|nr:type IV pilus assembly protein PilM [Lentisphaeria bacterium]
MAHDRILAIDIGATSIKLCEFEYASSGEVRLALFAHREYEEELSEGTRMGVVAGLLRQMLAEGGFTARKAMICMSGQSALTRFSRLPAMNYDRKQIKQLAEYEAIQNIPFAVSEVIWDYQLIASENAENIDVMSVVIKNEIVEQFTAAVQMVGCIPILVDVAPAACYNAVRANAIGDNECVVVLNIGGRSSNLIFAEGDHFFARTIPIAGHAITQQIAKEFGIGLPEAEELKRRHGFVALGGAYAEPESETAANVSKIIRNVMARLHGEIARSINVYRAQQKGSRPVRMYLTGGSSILSYCDVFFSEKLGIPVEYLNPFQVVTLLPSVDRNRLQEVAHMFSEAIGLGMRYASSCPIELSLIPETIRRQQNFDKKKPYFVFSMIAGLMILGVVAYGVSVRGTIFEQTKRELEKLQIENKPTLARIEEARNKARQKEDQYQAVSDLLLQQAKWPVILNEINRIKPNNLW